MHERKREEYWDKLVDLRMGWGRSCGRDEQGARDEGSNTGETHDGWLYKLEGLSYNGLLLVMFAVLQEEKTRKEYKRDDPNQLDAKCCSMMLTMMECFQTKRSGQDEPLILISQALA